MEIKKLITAGRIKPNLKLGQYFTVKQPIVDDLLKTAVISKNDHVIEVGAGTGAITKALCQGAGIVTAFEIDKQFKPFLRRLAHRYKNLSLRLENIRQAKLPTDYNKKVVGAIPYHISEVLLWTFRLEPVELMAFVVGLKFAKTLTAKPTEKEFAEVTVIFGSRFDISLEKIYEKKDFYPPAPTKSALIKLAFIEKKDLLSDPPRFILRDIWDHKQRRLKNALMEAFISYSKEKSEQGITLSKNQARALVQDLKIPKQKLEHLVDGANTFEIVENLRNFDYSKL